MNLIKGTMGEIDSILDNFSDNLKSFGSRVKISSIFTNYEKLIDKTFIVMGWVRTIRVLGKGDYLFAELNDGSCVKHLQVIILNHIENFDNLKNEGIGACVMIKGKLVKSQGTKQLVELLLNDNITHQLNILGKCEISNYKLIKSKDKIKLENLREIAHLRPRTNIIGCVTRIRSNLALAVHHFFQSLNFIYVNTPIITQIDCESSNDLFTVTNLLKNFNTNLNENIIKRDEDNLYTIDYSRDFFRKPVYLTSSGQLHLESYASAFSDVYSFGPTFRAELEMTERHLAEFWMIECEICFADLNDIMSFSEKFIKFCMKYILDKNLQDLEYIKNHYEKEVLENLNKILNTDFAKISYTTAIDILIDAANKKKNIFHDSVTWGIAFSPEHEKFLSDEYFKTPVFIFNFPKRVKSFYMRINEDNETVASMDLLMPHIGEVVGGSVREERFEYLKNSIEKEFKDDADKYNPYLDLRRFGSVPHSGFGLGFDRLVMIASGMKNIKDSTPYPRYPDYSEC